MEERLNYYRSDSYKLDSTTGKQFKNNKIPVSNDKENMSGNKSNCLSQAIAPFLDNVF